MIPGYGPGREHLESDPDANNAAPSESPDPFARQRKVALLLFWGGLAVAAVNPPGRLAALATIVATVGAFWLVGLWLNKLWGRYVSHRL